MNVEEHISFLAFNVFLVFVMVELALDFSHLGITDDTAITQFVNEIPTEITVSFLLMVGSLALLAAFSLVAAAMAVFAGYVVNRLLIWHKCRKPVRVYTP